MWFEKRKLLDVGSKVCVYTTWSWNKDLDVPVCRKRELFRSWKQSRNEEDKKKYCEAKKDNKKVMAMDQKPW